MQTIDRRQHARHNAEIACKLLRQAEGKYRTAKTADVSAGGASFTLLTPKPLQVGETLQLSVNWHGEALMKRSELINAVVVRTGPLLDKAQQVAVRFDEPQHQADALIGADAA